MKYVTREEKLILQMKNIEATLSDEKSPAGQKVFLITQNMSYLNELISSIIEPLREEAGDSALIELANNTFIPFIEKDEEEPCKLMRIVELRTKVGKHEECDFVHLASTFEEAVKWVKKYGRDWHQKEETEYKFAIFTALLDNDSEFESYDELSYVDKNGNIIETNRK